MVGSVSEDLRKQHAPQTPTTEHATADQEAHKTAILLVAVFAFIAFMLLLLVVPFAQEMREEKPAKGRSRRGIVFYRRRGFRVIARAVRSRKRSRVMSNHSLLKSTNRFGWKCRSLSHSRNNGL
jgi:hypothetical protein